MTRAACLGLLLASGCPRTTEPQRPGDDTSAPAPDVGTDAPEVAACGDDDTAFANADALPIGTTLVASFAVHDGALAAALSRLADHVAADGGGLAVPDAFAVKQWTWQVPLVASSIAVLGVRTGQLVAVHGTTGNVWLAPLSCAVDEFTPRIADRFALVDTGSGVIATPRQRDAIAHDVLVMPDAIVLVPPGRARKVLAAWSTPTSIGGPPPLRQRALTLDAAPVRVVARPSGLVDPRAGTTEATELALRVLGDGVEIVPPPQ